MDTLLRWKLILEDYGLDIDYIPGNNNIVAYLLSRLYVNSTQETTQESNYKKEILSEIDDIEELPKGNFLINLKLINQYNMGMYKNDSFCGLIHIHYPYNV